MVKVADRAVAGILERLPERRARRRPHDDPRRIAPGRGGRLPRSPAARPPRRGRRQRCDRAAGGHLGDVGEHRPGHGLRPRRRPRWSRTAASPTPTSRTTTGRSSPAVLGLADRLGGGGIWPAIAVGLVLTAAIVAATYALARRLSSTAGAVLASTITAGVAFAPTNFSFVDPHSYSETLGILAALGFLIALGAAETVGAGAGSLAAGAAAGLVMLTRPELAAAVALAGVAWTACGRLRRRRDPSSWQRRRRQSPSPCTGRSRPRAGVHRLLFENLYPVDQLRAAGDHVLRIQAPLTPHSFLELGPAVADLRGRGRARRGVGRALDAPRCDSRPRARSLSPPPALVARARDPHRHGHASTCSTPMHGSRSGPAAAVVRRSPCRARARRRGRPARARGRRRAGRARRQDLRRVLPVLVTRRRARPTRCRSPPCSLARLHLVELGRAARHAPRRRRLAGRARRRRRLDRPPPPRATTRSPSTGRRHDPGDRARRAGLRPGARMDRPRDAPGRAGAARAAADGALHALGAAQIPSRRSRSFPARCRRAADQRGEIARPARERRPAAPSTAGTVHGVRAHQVRRVVRPHARRLDPQRRSSTSQRSPRPARTAGRSMSGSRGHEDETDRSHRSGGLHRLAPLPTAARRGTRGRRRRRHLARVAHNVDACLDHDAFTLETIDCTRRRLLRAAFDGCDAIIHLAAQKIPRYGGALKTLESNVAGVNAAAASRSPWTPTS